MMESLRLLAHDLALSGGLPASFQYGFVTNAVLCALLVGPVLGSIGTMVVTKRLAFFSQAVGQAALTGVAIGILIGEPPTAPYASLFGFCVLFALALNFTKNRTRMSSDTLIGVFLSISMAIGASLLVWVAGQVNVHLVDKVLFGSILTVNDLDIAVLAVMSGLVGVVGLARYNRMLLASFNPQLAKVRGVQVAFLDYVFVVMVTVITVASVKIIGAMLVEALFLIPAAAARIWSGSMRGFFAITVAISTVSTLVGILAPMEFDLPIPSGGAIILCASLFFLAATVSRLFTRHAS
ncbi:MAG: metal ABC transporter permease [Alphaproteobacteria bacterium]|nr:metal ABC transporter permease [Alphaproteobacteria bacterium]MBF0391835.1 metal ABC transporter permease [Alphaproteobacteria bacterium]